MCLLWHSKAAGSISIDLHHGKYDPSTLAHDARATLVVCAVSLVGQWIEEATSKLGGTLSLYQVQDGPFHLLRVPSES